MREIFEPRISGAADWTGAVIWWGFGDGESGGIVVQSMSLLCDC